MEKLTIQKIWRSDKDKQGNSYVTQDGRPYTKVALITKEYGKEYVRGFGNEKNAQWKEGDIVEVMVERNGQYLNFKMPKEKDVLLERIEKIEEEIKAIWERLYEPKPVDEPVGDELPEAGPEEAPF